MQNTFYFYVYLLFIIKIIELIKCIVLFVEFVSVMDFSKTKLSQRTRSCYDKLYAEFCAKNKGNGRDKASISREDLSGSDVKPIILVDESDNDEDDNGVVVNQRMTGSVSQNKGKNVCQNGEVDTSKLDVKRKGLKSPGTIKIED